MDGKLKRVLCLVCGHKSAEGQSVCEVCGKPLPVKTVTEKGDPPPYNGAPFHDLSRWSDEVRRGVITEAEFARRLDEREALYKDRRASVNDPSLPEDTRAEGAEERRYGLMGIDELITAVQGLRCWRKTGNTAERDKALALADHATHMLHKAMVLNWESFYTIKAAAEEYLAQANGSPQDNASFGFVGEMHIAGM